jgi:hypothetical protein
MNFRVVVSSEISRRFLDFSRVAAAARSCGRKPAVNVSKECHKPRSGDSRLGFWIALLLPESLPPLRG